MVKGINVEQRIQSFLKEHAPSSLDQDTQDYLVQILHDQDSYEDPDALIQQLLQFWSEDAATVEQQQYLKDFVLDLASQFHTDDVNQRDHNSKNDHGDDIDAASTRMRLTTSWTIMGEDLQTGRHVEAEGVQDSMGKDNATDTSNTPIDSKREKTKGKRKGATRNKRQMMKSQEPVESLENEKCLLMKTENAQDLNHHHLLEDQASAWKDCLEHGVTWGGRGKGGRGEYAGAVNSIKSNIHLSNVTVCLENGIELLHGATMDIVKGHRYGLIGRNGVGKSTLLQRLSQRAIPGMPLDMRVLLVQQQIEGSSDSALNVLLSADLDREMLLREQQQLEDQLQSMRISDEDLGTVAERLGDIAAELDAIAADTAQERGMEILKGLQFTDEMISGPTQNLSGGWRMRLALAAAIFVQSDLLLFDECTNHLDLHGLTWLSNYLNQDKEKTLIVVSHDRSFLDAVCTDIVVMEHQRLKYHVGNFSEYERQQEEKAAREAQILDATERQRTKAMAFIQKQQAQAHKKSSDPNKQRQAKMIKEKKLERMGNYREDGKRYKLRSLKKLSEDHLRLAQKVVIEVDEPVIKMKFPDPVWPSGIGPDGALVVLEDFSFRYQKNSRTLLNHVTLSLNRGSKVALVGRNGSGKSTLCQLIAGKISDVNGGGEPEGKMWIHPSLRIGYITQYSVEELEAYSDQTVVEYIEEFLRCIGILSDILTHSSGNIRQYLGIFGLGGKHANQKIGSLSGGERMRLCFATVLSDKPHLLLLDESTNHVDIQTLESMSEALKDYQGSVLMVSHNQGFLSGFCKELWVLEDGGQINVNHSDTESFDEIFSSYRSSINGGKTFSSQIKKKSAQAAQASRQRLNANQSTGLL